MENKKVLSKEEIDVNLNNLNDWILRIKEGDSEKMSIYRKFKFDNFLKVLSFINLIASSLEELNHHPDIKWSYNQIELELTSHSEDDKLTDMDFLTATRLQEKYQSYLANGAHS